MDRSGEHGTFRQRMPLRDAGLLTEAEEQAFLDHAASCDACHKAWEDYAGDRDPGEEGHTFRHVPAALLARWDRTQADLPPLERDLIERHLSTCEACREDLELVQSRVAGVPLGVIPFDSRRQRRAWLQGAVVGALLAAAGVAIVLRPGPPVPDSGSVPWVVPGTNRGSEAAVTLPAGARRLLLAIPVPPSLAGASLQVSVTGPSGTRLMDVPVAPDRVTGATLMMVLTGTNALEAGRYTVTLTPEGEGEPGLSTFQLSLDRP